MRSNVGGGDEVWLLCASDEDDVYDQTGEEWLSKSSESTMVSGSRHTRSSWDSGGCMHCTHGVDIEGGEQGSVSIRTYVFKLKLKQFLAIVGIK